LWYNMCLSSVQIIQTILLLQNGLFFHAERTNPLVARHLTCSQGLLLTLWQTQHKEPSSHLAHVTISHPYHSTPSRSSFTLARTLHTSHVNFLLASLPKRYISCFALLSASPSPHPSDVSSVLASPLLPGVSSCSPLSCALSSPPLPASVAFA